MNTAFEGLDKSLEKLQRTCTERRTAINSKGETIVRSDAEMQEAARRRTGAELFENSGCPARHIGAEIERKGPWEATEKKIRDKTASGFLIALLSNRGTGKTQLAVEIIRHNCINLGRTAKFCRATDFFMAIKRTYKPDCKESEEDVIRSFCRPHLLVIDEIGKRGETEWESRLIFHLVNLRYESMKDTLLISNHSEKDFAESIGSSIASRMCETGGIINCDWESFR